MAKRMNETTETGDIILYVVISFCMFICTFDWLSTGHGGYLVMKATWQGNSGHAIRNG